MDILASAPTRGNSGPFALRPDETLPYLAGPGHLVIPPRRRPLAEILADPAYSNGAKLLAEYLDGRCLAFGRWAAWPKVSTIAEALGWTGDSRAFRKRVERAARELVEGGDLARPRLGELVEWFNATGEARGLDWPKGLRRSLCRSAAVCVLGWKLAEAETTAQTRLPTLTACDIGVASSAPVATLPASPNVACDPPGMSHEAATEMSHPQNSLSGNVRTEPTLDVVAIAARGEGEPSMPVEPVATVKAPPAPVPPPPPQPDPSRRFAAYRLAGSLLGRDDSGRFRDLRVRVGDDGSIAWTVPPGGGPAPDAAELADIERLKPEFLEELRSRGVKVPRSPSPTPLTTEGSGPPRPAKVRRDVRADITARIGGLIDPETTNADVLATARALAAALGPHADDEATQRTFLKWCGNARTGRDAMSVAILIDAFEAAGSGRSPERRGAVFVHLVKEFLAEAKRRGCSPSPEPAISRSGVDSMPEPEKPKAPPSIRTPGADPVRKPIPAGSLSSGAVFRNALEAAGDPDPDRPDAAAVAEVIAIKHAEIGRNPTRPPGAI